MNNIITPSIAFAVVLTAALSAKAGTIIINDDGQYCREYTETVTVGGRLQTSYGTACQQPDGQWQVQTSDNSARNIVAANNNQPFVYQPPAVIYTQPPVTRYIVRTRPVYAPPPAFFAYRYPQPHYRDRNRDWERDRDRHDHDDRDHDRDDHRRHDR